MSAFYNGIHVWAETRIKFSDGESTCERKPPGERVHHWKRGFSNSQTKHAAINIWEMSLHRFEWINSIERGRENLQHPRVLQAVRGETIYIHVCYHNRKILWRDDGETKSIRDTSHP